MYEVPTLVINFYASASELSSRRQQQPAKWAEKLQPKAELPADVLCCQTAGSTTRKCSRLIAEYLKLEHGS